jgi:hypothetical protein
MLAQPELARLMVKTGAFDGFPDFVENILQALEREAGSERRELSAVTENVRELIAQRVGRGPVAARDRRSV